MMKRTLLLCLILVGLFLLSGAAFAADITVTVTLQQLGVGVSPASWALGTMAGGASQSSYSSGSAGHFVATNSGNVAQQLTIGTTSTTPSAWAAGATSGHNVYVIGFGIGTSPYTTEPTYTTFTGSSTLAASVPGSGTVAFDLKFTAPAADSTFSAGGETFTVAVSASPV